VPLTIGIDVGGTKILGGLVDGDGTVVTCVRRSTPLEGGSALTRAIIDLARDLAIEQPVKAVGVSAAGFFSADRTVVLASPNIPGWQGLALRDEISEGVGVPVITENDANCAAWGEALFGAGMGVRDLLVLTVGTGVGGGAIVGGELVRGGFGLAAEFGHIRAVPDGLLCGCGQRGCLEQYGSGSALVRFARTEAERRPEAAAALLAYGDGTARGISGLHVTAAAAAGDAFAISAFAEIGNWLGAGLASLASVLDPALVVIGGGVAEAGSLLMDPIRSSFARHLPYSEQRSHPEVVPARLGVDAGMIGAAALAQTLI
jgi:glucokinase